MNAIETKLSQRDYSGRGMRLAESVRILLLNSLKHTHSRGCRLIESVDLFVALLQDGQSFPAGLLKRLGVDRERAIQEIEDRSKEGSHAK